MSQDKSQNSTQKQLMALLNGVLTDTFSKTIFSPFEVIKMRLQNQSEIIKQGYMDTRYQGIVDCAKKIVQKEGILGLWKGNFTHILLCVTNNSLSFPLNSLISQTINAQKQNGQAQWVFSNLAAGGLAGFFTSAFSYPLDLARTKLTNDFQANIFGNKKQYRGIIDIFQKTLSTDGVKGLYRGFIISCFSIVAYRSVYFGLSSSFKPLIPKNNFPLAFCFSWTVSITAAMASYMIDTVKRRMMMTSGQLVKYRGSIDCFKQIITNEGFTNLFRGYSLTLFQSVSSAVVLAIYLNLN